MTKKMDDIARPGSGIKSRKNHDAPQADSSKEHTRKSERPKSRKQSSEDGFIYSSVRPLKEREAKREENPFLQKLQDKRRSVQNRLSHGGDFRRPGKRLWKYVFGGVVLFLLIVYAFFPSVSVKIEPRTEDISLAASEFLAAASSTAPLSFQTVTVTEQTTGSAEATAAEQSEEKASGKLTIYNTYSEESQRLIRNTRFRSPDGLIYRVNNSVEVPGMQGDTPGQITVTVYADQPGADYNFTETGAKFTIPGFQGSPALFESYYAETATPLAGGYSGVTKVVADEDLQRVEDQAAEDLKTRLLEKARADLAEGYILFDGAAFISYETEVQDRSNLEDNTAEVNVAGTLEGVVFDKALLARRIAESLVSEYDGSEVVVTDWSGISFAVTEDETAEDEEVNNNEGEARPDFSNLREVAFTLSGDTTLLWKISKQEVAETLAGSDKDEFDQIMNEYRYQINRADTVMRPFWNDTFPTAPSEINIEILEVEIPAEDE